MSKQQRRNFVRERCESCLDELFEIGKVLQGTEKFFMISLKLFDMIYRKYTQKERKQK